MKFRAFLLCTIAASAYSASARADSLLVVPSCGAATVYGGNAIGQYRPGTQDSTGVQCSSSAGGGGGGGGGGAVYGTDAIGAAPTKNPLFLAGIDGSGNIKAAVLTASGALTTADALADAALGTPADAAATVGGNGSTIAQLKQAVTQLAAILAKLPTNTAPLQTNGAVAANQGTAAAVGSAWPFYLTVAGAANASGNPAFVQLTAGTASIGSVTVSNFPSTQPISAASLPLPTGASTSANQPTNAAQGSTTSGQTGNLGLAAASTAAPALTTAQSYPLSLTLAGALRVDGSGVTQPISASALPLPTGAATSANQSTEIAAQGTPADTAYAGTGSASIIAALKGVYNATLAPLAAGSNIIGKVGIDQTTPGTTNKVTLGSDNVAVTPSNAATAATVAAQTNVQSAAGTSASTLITVQGSGSGVPIPVNVASGNISSASSGFNDGTPILLSSNTSSNIRIDKRSRTMTVETGSDDFNAAIVPVVTTAGTTAVGKTSQGNLYSAYAINSTTTAGYLVCINATAAPAASGAITPVDVAYLGGAIGSTASINYGAGPPSAYATGITCLITTSLTTYTAGGNSFISVRVR